jgi:hypothetical protein
MHRALLVPGVSGAAVRLQSDDQAGCGCYEQGEHDARFEREEPGQQALVLTAPASPLASRYQTT